jgi:aminoglycoside 3-N-acetyltransferase
MMTADYTYRDIVRTYAQLGVRRGDTVLVAGNLGRLMNYEATEKAAVPRAHFAALNDLLGPDGTIVVPTASTNLCHTDIVFDPAGTASHKMGVFSEFVRRQEGARRSFHPFVSYSAIGKHADYITSNVARQAFGPETPEARLIELGTLHLAIGLPPRLTTATNHHLEQVMGVPYRYAREFLHPVKRNGTVQIEPFYLHVWYKGVQRDRNTKIFERFGARHPIPQVSLGRGIVSSYRMNDFYTTGIQMFRDDIFVWTSGQPESKPYREWM